MLVLGSLLVEAKDYPPGSHSCKGRFWTVPRRVFYEIILNHRPSELLFKAHPSPKFSQM